LNQQTHSQATPDQICIGESDQLAPGIGHRLDGWANRDLNVGAFIALAPNLQPLADVLNVDQATVRKVLQSWDSPTGLPTNATAHLR
jgi:hypothetical protein